MERHRAIPMPDVEQILAAEQETYRLIAGEYEKKI